MADHCEVPQQIKVALSGNNRSRWGPEQFTCIFKERNQSRTFLFDPSVRCNGFGPKEAPHPFISISDRSSPGRDNKGSFQKARAEGRR